MCVQIELPESSGEVDEEKRSFGVLTVTSSTSIDRYFASKLANLQSKAQQNTPASEAVLQKAIDIASNCDVANDECQKQLEQQLKRKTVKHCKKKQRKVDSDCQPESRGMLKKKKKRQHDNDSTRIVLDHSNDSQNRGTAKTTKKSKKRQPTTTEDTESREMEHNIIPNKRKKSTHVSS